MEFSFEIIWTLVKLPLGGVLLGVCAGMLTGLFGAGGGFIITPALNILLGLPYNIAVGTSTCQILGASSFALYHRSSKKMMGFRLACLVGIGVPLGTFFGVRTVNLLGMIDTLEVAGRTLPAQETIFTAIFCVFLSLIASWMLFDNFYLRRGKDHDDDHKGSLAWVKLRPMIRCQTIPSGPFSAPVLTLLGLVMGFLGGLLGIGGGVIMMPVLFYLIGQETQFAALTSTRLVFATSLFSTAMHASYHNINYVLVVFLVIGAFSGAKAGVALQAKLSGKSIRKYFAFVVLAAVIMVSCKLISIFVKAPVDGL